MKQQSHLDSTGKRTDRGSGDTSVRMAGDSLRIQARYLDENHDLVRGVLNTLVNNIVGTGIRIEALAKDKRRIINWI